MDANMEGESNLILILLILDYFTKMAIFMMVNGIKTRGMVMEH
jgi:hypothetical protein